MLTWFPQWSRRAERRARRVTQVPQPAGAGGGVEMGERQKNDRGADRPQEGLRHRGPQNDEGDVAAEGNSREIAEQRDGEIRGKVGQGEGEGGRRRLQVQRVVERQRKRGKGIIPSQVCEENGPTS